MVAGSKSKDASSPTKQQRLSLSQLAAVVVVTGEDVVATALPLTVGQHVEFSEAIVGQHTELSEAGKSSAKKFMSSSSVRSRIWEAIEMSSCLNVRRSIQYQTIFFPLQCLEMQGLDSSETEQDTEVFFF